MLGNAAWLGIVCIGGLFVGCLLGVLAMSLAQMARRNSEASYERGLGSVAVVASDGGDDGGVDLAEREVSARRSDR